MSAVTSLFIICLLTLVVLIGVGMADLNFLFGIVLPYFAAAVFLLGLIARVLRWAKSPVPFRIPTTCGQQKSLPWIKQATVESPSNMWGVLRRMFLEVFLFRSLFRNTKATVVEGSKLVYGSNQWLWLGAIAFHYSFLVIFIRHFRFVLEPTPQFLIILQELDGFFQIGVPSLLTTDIILIGAVLYLFLRRATLPQIRMISLTGDYFPLLLILGIAGTGVCMRYFSKVDIVSVKQMVIGLVTFNPVAVEGVGIIFYIHLFMVTALLAYFPFSKLVHMAGIFFSPTRNLANNNRMVRHINPWDYPVKTHSYSEYEDEFRDVMKDAGMPLEKE